MSSIVEGNFTPDLKEQDLIRQRLGAGPQPKLPSPRSLVVEEKVLPLTSKSSLKLNDDEDDDENENESKHESKKTTPTTPLTTSPITPTTPLTTSPITPTTPLTTSPITPTTPLTKSPITPTTPLTKSPSPTTPVKTETKTPPITSPFSTPDTDPFASQDDNSSKAFMKKKIKSRMKFLKSRKKPSMDQMVEWLVLNNLLKEVSD